MNVFGHKFLATLTAVALIAPGLTAQDNKAGAETASKAVEQFLRAAADSNLTRMGQLFGTDKGPVSETGKPNDWDRRAVVIQTAFTGITVRALAETSAKEDDEMLVTTELARGSCSVVLPITAVKADKGWLVRSFDFTQAWDGVNRPCQGRN